MHQPCAHCAHVSRASVSSLCVRASEAKCPTSDPTRQSSILASHRIASHRIASHRTRHMHCDTALGRVESAASSHRLRPGSGPLPSSSFSSSAAEIHWLLLLPLRLFLLVPARLLRPGTYNITGITPHWPGRQISSYLAALPCQLTSHHLYARVRATPAAPCNPGPVRLRIGPSARQARPSRVLFDPRPLLPLQKTTKHLPIIDVPWHNLPQKVNTPVLMFPLPASLIPNSTSPHSRGRPPPPACLKDAYDAYDSFVKSPH
jgi:hypothetical protein